MSNQALAPCGQTHHDDAYPRVLGLHTNRVSLSIRPDEFTRGHGTHVRHVDSIGFRHGTYRRAEARRNQRVESRRRREKGVESYTTYATSEVKTEMRPGLFRVSGRVREARRASKAVWLGEGKGRAVEDRGNWNICCYWDGRRGVANGVGRRWNRLGLQEAKLVVDSPHLDRALY